MTHILFKLQGNIPGYINIVGMYLNYYYGRISDEYNDMRVELTKMGAIIIPEEVAKERIKGRSEKEDRKDDSDPKVIEKRFDEYKEKTLPLVDVYEKSKRLFKVDGTKETDEVLKRVKNKLNLSKK